MGAPKGNCNAAKNKSACKARKGGLVRIKENNINIWQNRPYRKRKTSRKSNVKIFGVYEKYWQNY